MTEPQVKKPLDIEAALDRYAHTIRRICFLYLKRREDVEDVFQDVFLSYLQRQEPFQCDEHEKAWLLRTAINRCKDLAGAFWHRQVGALDEDIMAQVPEDSHEILEAVNQLPPQERTAIYLFYYEGYSAQEIAGMTSSKTNTIYSHLHRARKRLHKKLGGFEHEEDDPESF
ncbi:MAG: sigma-70 family RNA polymerase sigma factor [Clostridiaceae bacterium]|nr:sigma-70 family RNA polymerase sigma factor [Clostridiaceae bacterium]